MEKLASMKGLAYRTVIVLVAVGFVAAMVMLSLPERVLAGGGNSNVSTGSLPTLTEQGTPKEAVLGSTPQIGYHVDFHNGEFRYPFMALRVPGVSGYGDMNMDIRLLFTYRSRISYNGQFGTNWDFFYYKRVALNGNILYYYDGTGRKDTFTGWDSVNNEWDTNPDGYLGKFTKDTGSTNERYKYTMLHGQTLTFDSDGRLYRITDRNGNYVQVYWKADPNEWQIDKIRDTTNDDNREFTFSYYGTGRLEKITDFNSREVKFDYDSNDDLIKISLPTDSSITPEWQFTYTSGYETATLNHNLETITNPENDQVLKNYYVTVVTRQDMVKKQEYGDEEIYRIYQDTSSEKTIVTNGTKHRRDYFWDDTYTNVPDELWEHTGEWDLNEATGSVSQGVSKYRSGDPSEFKTQWIWNSDRQMTKLRKQLDGSNWNAILYTYNSNGSLTEVRRDADDTEVDEVPDLVTTYSYDTDYFHQVKTITNPEGDITTYFYDYDEDAEGDLNDDGVTDEEFGNLVRIEYPDVTDPASQTDIYKYFQYAEYSTDKTGQLKAEFNERGVKTLYEYYTANNYTSGEVKYFLKEKTRDEGTGGTYLNLEWTYEYDKVGNVTEMTDPNSITTVYDVNNWNLVTKITYSGATSPVSNYETKREYFKTFQLKKEEVKNIDSSGSTQTNQYWTTEYTYNDVGKVATKVVEVQKDPDSASTTGTYTYTYDKHYNLKQVEKPEGNDTKQIKHDERELKFTETIIGGVEDVDPFIQYDYHYNGPVKKIKDAEGNLTHFDYDGFGRKTKERDDLDNYTTFEYDKNGNVTVIERYDEEGTTDTLMVKTKKYYDELNRLWKEERANQVTPSETYVTYTYTRDKRGNITKIDGPNDTDTTFTYDNLDRKLTETDDAGNAIEYEYEDCGCGLVTEVTHKEKDGAATLEYVIEYGYDELGRKTSLTVNDKDSAGTQETTYKYDSMGNLVEINDAENNVKDYLYGGVNRKLLKSTEDHDGSNETVTKYYYDKNGNLTDIEDDNGNKTHYKYDGDDRVEGIYFDYYTGGPSPTYDGCIEYEYDDNDNITKVTSQKSSSTDTDTLQVSLTYDDLDQVTQADITKAQATGGNEKLTYAWDAANRLIEAIAYKPAATQISDVDIEYDPLSRVTAEKQKLFTEDQRTYSFDYNDYGALTEITYDNNDTIDITRTAIHNIDQIKESSNVLVDYTYVGPHRPKQIDYYNDTDVVFTYDGYRRVTDLDNKYSGGTSIKSFEYEYDDMNNREYEESIDDSTYDVYTYNKAYKLTKAELGSEDSSGTNPTKTIDYYLEDLIGNRDRKEVTESGRTTKTYYCPNDLNEYFYAKASRTAINCGTVQSNRTHDDNGNLTKDADFTYTYDYANRLVKVEDAVADSTVAEYWYDALGRRIKKDDQTTETHFYYHGHQVIEEYSYSSGETLEARYIYGNGGVDDVLIMMRTESSELDEYYYYHKNSLGSIVAVTDSSENLDEQYSYDPYGSVYMKDGNGSSISSSAIKNPYLFTGRRYDEETEKYYYRARQYDPDTGRFMQRDLIGYVDGMNLYEYIGTNPTNYVDPLGLCKQNGSISSQLSNGGRKWCPKSKKMGWVNSDPNPPDDSILYALWWKGWHPNPLDILDTPNETFQEQCGTYCGLCCDGKMSKETAQYKGSVGTNYLCKCEPKGVCKDGDSKWGDSRCAEVFIGPVLPGTKFECRNCYCLALSPADKEEDPGESGGLVPPKKR